MKNNIKLARKIARKHAKQVAKLPRYKIVIMENSYGRDPFDMKNIVPKKI